MKKVMCLVLLTITPSLFADLCGQLERRLTFAEERMDECWEHGDNKGFTAWSYQADTMARALLDNGCLEGPLY